MGEQPSRAGHPVQLWVYDLTGGAARCELLLLSAACSSACGQHATRTSTGANHHLRFRCIFTYHCACASLLIKLPKRASLPAAGMPLLSTPSAFPAVTYCVQQRCPDAAGQAHTSFLMHHAQCHIPHLSFVTHAHATALSPMLLGKQIDGIWHTSVVVEGVEIFFGCVSLLILFLEGTQDICCVD